MSGSAPGMLSWMDRMTIYVLAVTISAIVTILDIAGRLSNERRPAMFVGLALAIPVLALGLYEYGLLALTRESSGKEWVCRCASRACSLTGSRPLRCS